jgi:hypothetical protein
MDKFHRHHPDVHAPAADWSEEQTLHVAACYSNPMRWDTRRRLANDFRRHMMQSSNVKLYVGELAYGDRPFEITDPELYPNDIQLRTTHELFHKENILNAVIRRFPPNWKYGAIIDMDFHFTRHDWALEAVHQLQMYAFVQLFSTYSDLTGRDLGKGHRPLGANNSFAYNWFLNHYSLPHGFVDGGWKLPPGTDSYYDAVAMTGGKKWVSVGATGGAWSFRRSAFDTVGGLLDRCILGHGDWFMAFGLIGQTAPDMHIDGYTRDYRDYITSWQNRATRLTKNIGYIDCHALHHFHGPKVHRKYSSRDLLLVKHEYEPSHDVHADWQGIYQLNPNKPRFRDDIRRYFLMRNEDYPHTG